MVRRTANVNPSDSHFVTPVSGDGPEEKVYALLAAVTYRITTMQLRLLELSARIEIVRAETQVRQEEMRGLITSNRMMLAEFNMLVDELNAEMLSLASIGLEKNLLAKLVLDSPEKVVAAKIE